jgi:hypothetical protein
MERTGCCLCALHASEYGSEAPVSGVIGHVPTYISVVPGSGLLILLEL